uniref:SyrB-like regulator n=1 Tax=Neorhizobium sp. EC2-8 TaxID=3129230 RepID=UPI003100C1A9
MADENNPGTIAEIAEADAPAKTPAPKKQRAPRRQKAVAEATVAASVAKTPKVSRTRRKRGEQAVEAKLSPEETQGTAKNAPKEAVKNTGRKRAPKQTVQTAKPAVPALDDMADLVQLEEENKRLRKTLADKLRTENADLRKRLGLA